MNRVLLSTSSVPVVSILSPSPSASRRVQEVLYNCFGLEPVETNNDVPFPQLSADCAAIPFSSSSSSRQSSGIGGIFGTGFPKKWDSTVSACPSSGVHINLLAASDDSKLSGSFSLLSISKMEVDVGNNASSSSSGGIRQAVSSINSGILSNVSPLSMSMNLLKAVGRKPPVLSLFDNLSLPVLDLPARPMIMNHCNNNEKSERPLFDGLKEIAYVTTACNDSSVHNLSRSALSRPKPGLFQWPLEGIGDHNHHNNRGSIGSSSGGLCIRPLPPAELDRKSIPFVLVFDCESVGQAQERASQCAGVSTFKIGYGGLGNGQIRVKHHDLAGLDIRFCESRSVRAMFNEAQEAILSSSNDEAQSKNTMLTSTTTGETDSKVGNGDCWGEFRATLTEPMGYFRSGFFDRTNSTDRKSVV